MIRFTGGIRQWDNFIRATSDMVCQPQKSSCARIIDSTHGIGSESQQSRLQSREPVPPSLNREVHEHGLRYVSSNLFERSEVPGCGLRKGDESGGPLSSGWSKAAMPLYYRFILRLRTWRIWIHRTRLHRHVRFTWRLQQRGASLARKRLCARVSCLGHLRGMGIRTRPRSAEFEVYPGSSGVSGAISGSVSTCDGTHPKSPPLPL